MLQLPQSPGPFAAPLVPVGVAPLRSSSSISSAPVMQAPATLPPSPWQSASIRAPQILAEPALATSAWAAYSKLSQGNFASSVPQAQSWQAVGCTAPPSSVGGQSAFLPQASPAVTPGFPSITPAGFAPMAVASNSVPLPPYAATSPVPVPGVNPQAVPSPQAGVHNAAQQFSSQNGEFGKGVSMTILDPTEQDSDIMERMNNGIFAGSEGTGDVELISLGCSCGPKLSFKDIGRGAATLPFDWSRTKVEALLHFIDKDFANFFDASDCIKFADVNGTKWTAFRSNMHSFWHDDPTAPAMRERYNRRIQRFLETDARTKPVLFVRSVAQSAEIPRTAELLALLIRKFGPYAKLLTVVDFQGPGALGPCLVEGLDNLMLCFYDTASAPSQAAPYGDLVKFALSWAIGQPVNVRRLSSLAEAQALATPTDWGMYGAGMPAFL